MKKTAPWYQIKNLTSQQTGQAAKAEVRIFGEIGWEVNAEEFVRALDEFDPQTELDVRISSVGGSIIEGMHIYNRLKMHKGHVGVMIEGFAASMATVIAMAGDHIAMMPGWFMIHNPSGGAWGEAKDMEKAAEVLRTMKDTLVDIYVGRTKLDRDVVSDLMDEETWYKEGQALEAGFIDEIVELDAELDLAATLRSFDWDRAGFNSVPVAVLDIATSNPDAPGDRRSDSGTVESGDDTRGDAASTHEENSMTPEEIAAAKAKAHDEGRQAEVNRRAAIKNVFSGHEGHDEVLNMCLDDAECTAEKAQAALLAAIKAKNDQSISPSGAAIVTQDRRDNLVNGFTNALLARVGIKSDDTRNEFRGYSLRDMARECAIQAGVRGVNAMRPLEYVGAAFSHSSSDFPSLLENVLNKKLLAEYEAYPSTYQEWCEIGEVTDFKPTSRVQLGSLNNILTVPEGGEFKEGTFGEEKETVQALTKGRLLSITRQGIINDDLGGFSRIAGMMGRAARRTINSDAYGVLTANAAMADGIAMFHADHNNLAGTGAALSVATLSEGKKAMRMQKFASTDDEYIQFRPDILLVPVALEDTAKTLIASETDPSQSNSRKPNIHRNSLIVIADPTLDANSTTAWYLLDSSNPLVEVVFLDGVQEPFLDSEEGFTIDGVRWKVRVDYGYDSTEWRSGWKNAGA